LKVLPALESVRLRQSHAHTSQRTAINNSLLDGKPMPPFLAPGLNDLAAIASTHAGAEAGSSLLLAVGSF
jgi:hypothetical protein